jgi:hypothetical protein
VKRLFSGLKLSVKSGENKWNLMEMPHLLPQISHNWAKKEESDFSNSLILKRFRMGLNLNI